MSYHSETKCKTCKYRAKGSAQNGCDYIVIVGKCRGCSVKECDKYEKGKKLNGTRKWVSGLTID